MSPRTSRLQRRGNVSVEYVFLASLVGVGVTLSLVLPSAFGDALVGAGANMDRGEVAAADAPPAPAPPAWDPTDDAADASDDPTGDDTADPDGWGDDPWGGPADPPAPSVGAVVTILLTLSDPNIPPWLAATLADNVVRYVSPVPLPRILVVRDDFHNGEDVQDTPYITGIMRGMMGLSTYDVTYLDEPTDGLTSADLEGFDVIWFSNPGYPMDDAGTLDALQQALAGGVGVVLQGDDMSWTAQHAFDDQLSLLTGLDHQTNGTSACGQAIDNNTGGHYSVTFGSDSPILAGLEGVTVLYGNDIDHATVTEDGTQVHATASAGGCGLEIPVVVSSY